MICWRCHSNSVNTGSRLPICSDVKTRKRRNVVGIDMIPNNRIVPVLHYLQTVHFIKNLKTFHEYLIQHSLKSRGTKDHCRRVKVPGSVPYWKACVNVKYFYHIIVYYRIEYFYFPNQVPKGAFTFNSHDCLTYIKQHMTAKSVHIKD